MGYRQSYSEDIEGRYFEFDTKTGDMVLRFGSNHNQFDRFRSKLEGGGLEISKKEYGSKSVYDSEYGRLSESDPDPEIDFTKYTRYGNNRHHLHFSITMRSNAKRRFKFFEVWEAHPNLVWKPDPINPKIKDRYGYERANGKNENDWEDVRISKSTERDRKWEQKVLRNGQVYF